MSFFQDADPAEEPASPAPVAEASTSLDDDLDEPLPAQCRIDDPDCESCQ